jgi:short-subunit dehydrogenase
MHDNRIALVTGANQGIGLEVAKPRRCRCPAWIATPVVS